MAHWIYVTGTEAYYENVPDAEEHIRSVTRQLADWWEELFGPSKRYQPSFARFREDGIPEDELSNESLRDRLRDASEWTWEHRFPDGFVGSLQILDWVEQVERFRWPLGVANIGTAMTNTPQQAGITNVYYFFEKPVHYYFREVREHGTVFHEMLHNYSVEHWHGSATTSNEATLIVPVTWSRDDKTCLWFGDNDIRHAIISPCTLQTVFKHIRDHRRPSATSVSTQASRDSGIE